MCGPWEETKSTYLLPGLGCIYQGTLFDNRIMYRSSWWSWSSEEEGYMSMRICKTKIECPCVFSTLQPWRGEIKYLLRSKYLWFPRLHASLLSENNNWNPGGTFIHQHSFASNRMKDEMASPDYPLLIVWLIQILVHQKSVSWAQLPQKVVEVEILFHYFLSCLRNICPSSLPHDPSMAEIHKYFFFNSFVILNINFLWCRNPAL